MTAPPEIHTERLRLRRWTAADSAPFAVMNADPEVMKHFPCVLSRAESDAAQGRIEAHFERHGFGLWVLELTGVAPFIGIAGLLVPRFEAHFTPCVEIGWRLSPAYWNRGYATEAARGALDFGFRHLDLAEIVSMTTPGNTPSRRVMEKIGMTYDPTGDFDHPLIPAGHALARHVLYRIGKPT